MMEKTPYDLAQLIEDRLKALETNAFAVEQRAGLPPDAIRNVLRSQKKDGPTLGRAQQICDALGLEFYIGPRRESGQIEQVTIDATEYVHVPLYDAALSAGPGVENGSRNIIDRLAFRRDWMRRIGVSPTSACLARVDRDSMAPTLQSGDMVLIDTSRTELSVRPTAKNGQRRLPIYAFVEDGQARVKRIDRPEPNLLILMSDNPDYCPEILTGPKAAAIEIIGKVVWWGHTSKE